MKGEPVDVDHRVLKLIVGLIALTLAPLTYLFAWLQLPDMKLTSISASYWYGGVPQTIFIGFLFAIAAFLLAFEGTSRLDAALSNLAGAASVSIAMFPCTALEAAPLRGVVQSVTHASTIHTIAASTMFIVLAYFCFGFYTRAIAKNVDGGNPAAGWRSWIYLVCGVLLVASMLVMALAPFLPSLSGGSIAEQHATLTFWGEAVGLVSFGVSWLTSSKALVAQPSERLYLIPASLR